MNLTKTAVPALAVAIFIAACPGYAAAQAADAALFQSLRWRNIGPANMQGRVTDIEARDDDYRVVYVASASGGVFKSLNAGTTWEPIFDRYGSASMGDIALSRKDPNLIWVGTGESCVRNSVGWGDGVYKSTDGGRTFTHMGLRDTHHISEVIIHPENPEIVYVAAQGRLWGYNDERGVYRTADGGKSWQRLVKGLPADDRTGCSDLKMDPTNPRVLYAAFWERIRRPWRFDSGGPKGGIFKSVDGGDTWTKLEQGLPAGPTGKIGLAVYAGNSNIVMAIVEHGYQPTARTDPDEYKDMSRPGTGVYRSENGGKTWKFMNRYNNRPFYYSHIYINPGDDQRVYLLAGSAMVSTDGGRSFRSGMGGISGDFHALWIDPHNKDRFYVGNDKGTSLTHDHGQQFVYLDNMAIGQFYAVTCDMRDPYYVYGGLQDNGVWGGPSNSREVTGILTDHWFKFHSGDGFHVQVDPTDWTTVYTESQGGALRRNHAVFRQDSTSIRPNTDNVINFRDYFPKVDELPAADRRRLLRANWSTPFIISPHNPRTLYYGTQHLLKSVDRGETWTIISSDLSTNDPERTNPESGGLTRDVTGAETNATILTISESPLRPGLIWAGTDDGKVHVTLNDGGGWTEVTSAIPGLPAGLWVSRVCASRHNEKVAYVTVDGHRSDDFRPYVYKTSDVGKTWSSVAGNIPDGHSVYVITEDPFNPNLLFVGTEFAAFASVDGGKSWHKINNEDLPTVAVHDLVIHPRDRDLIAGTHGRSIYILDDITALEQLNDQVLASEAFLFEPKLATIWRGISRGAERGHFFFQGRNPLTITHRPPANSPPELQNSAFIHYYLRSAPGTDAVLEISDVQGAQKRTVRVPREAGINRYQWDLRFDPSPLEREISQLAQKLRTLQSEDERQKLVDDARARLAALADSEAQRRELARSLDQLQAFAGFGGEEAAGPMGGLREPQGSPAGPGLYLIRLEVGGRSYTTTLTVRMDPLFADFENR
ncbi:MAG: hypothetical protein ABIG68_03975 [Acidobacteriota bacterium]